MYIADSTDTPCQIEWAGHWFAQSGTREARMAQDLCIGCPERLKCLASVLKYEERHGTQPGIYGGWEPQDRAALLVKPDLVSA